MSTEARLLLVFLLWTALLQHDHQELGVRGHEDLVAGGPGPEEGHRVGGVQVPHHGPGGAGEAGHEVLILRRGYSRVIAVAHFLTALPGLRWCCPRWS